VSDSYFADTVKLQAK